MPLQCYNGREFRHRQRIPAAKTAHTAAKPFDLFIFLLSPILPAFFFLCPPPRAAPPFLSIGGSPFSADPRRARTYCLGGAPRSADLEVIPLEEEKKRRAALWAGPAAVCLLLGCLLAPPVGASELQPAAEAFSPAGQARQIIPVGQAVGIKLFSDGVLVVGLSEISTPEGPRQPGRDCGLRTGDLITHINGQDVDTVEQVQAMVAAQPAQPLTIRAVRGEKSLQLSALPAVNRQGTAQLGIWLRDSMAGIGTVTYYDPANGTFAALGHGINDTDTALLMPLESGSIMRARVSDVKKGTAGQPGELHGVFQLQQDAGTLSANTPQGIFGTVDRQALTALGAPMEAASWEQTKVGPATILSNVQGEKIQEFQIRITHLSQNGDRSMTIQVTDPALLELTGGIVQGMSGSPILQDGRVVGAVTHVLVNDPTRGYGIPISRMLSSGDSAAREEATA